MSDRTQAAVVWTVWVFMTLAALGLVVVYGVRVPFRDEWGHVVPFLSGEWQITLHNLWAPLSNHHIAIPKAILIALDRLSGLDMRAGMFLNVVLLSLASGLLIQTVKRVRGHLVWSDSLFPIVLLNWGHFKNLLWSIQVNMVLVAVLSCFVLVTIVRNPGTPSLRSIVSAGFCALALPLCQAGGVALGAAFGVWLIGVGAASWVSGDPKDRRRTGLTTVLGVAAVAVASLSYLPPLQRYPPATNPWLVAWNSIRVLCLSYGPVHYPLRPPDQQLSIALPIATAAILLLTASLLLYVWRLKREERLRVGGLLLFLGGFVALALGIAWGRHRYVLADRYPILVAPALCAVYFVWVLYASPYIRTCVCAVLCLAAIVYVPSRSSSGVEWAKQNAAQGAAFERDILDGLPLAEILSRHVGVIGFKGPMRRGMTWLHKKEIGMYRLLNTSEPNGAPGRSPSSN